MKPSMLKRFLLLLMLLSSVTACLLIGHFVLPAIFWDSADENEAVGNEFKAVLDGAKVEVHQNPTSSKARAALAQALENCGRYAEAITEWKTALKFNTIDKELDGNGIDVSWAKQHIQECEDALKR